MAGTARGCSSSARPRSPAHHRHTSINYNASNQILSIVDNRTGDGVTELMNWTYTYDGDRLQSQTLDTTTSDTSGIQLGTTKERNDWRYSSCP